MVLLSKKFQNNSLLLFHEEFNGVHLYGIQQTLKKSGHMLVQYLIFSS